MFSYPQACDSAEVRLLCGLGSLSAADLERGATGPQHVLLPFSRSGAA